MIWRAQVLGIPVQALQSVLVVIGSMKYSAEDGISRGKLLGIRDSVSYDGTDLKSLQTNYRGAVDEYIGFCKAQGKPLPDTVA
jgi:predicted HicB family RNase H-like nuclease